ncbi:MAG TPA: helicase-related protein, partial [Candidatus Melainabacteria bacterium]|nr:helicase-related protein [Candidatus Melainabacteria bacterium]
QIPLEAIASEFHWNQLYDRILDLADNHKSTLVFVNTRRLAERIAYVLTERLGEDLVGTHHGSLSKKLRFEAEQKLKAGEYKILVATASLELGIDIGDVDLVCQIGSARSIATALQRIGRAGHWLGAIPKGRIFATTRDDLIECAALVEAIYDGDLDRLTILEKPMDILAQQLVATCSTGDWQEDDLYEMVVKAYPYRNLSREEFDKVLSMLSEGLAGQYYSYGRYLHRDTVNKRVRGRRGAKMYAITNGGAIPEKNVFTVYAQPGEIKVGTLDEDFAVEIMRGDIILLGNTSWRVKNVEGMASVVNVEDARGKAPTIPFWLGESPGRTRELSQYVSKIRELVNQAIKHEDKDSALLHLISNCRMTGDAAQQIIKYIEEGKAVLGEVATLE